MSSFAVRPAEIRDAEAMTVIAAQNPTAPQWTVIQFCEMLQPRSEGITLCRALLVVEDAGQIAGFAVSCALCAVFPVEAELESLAVAPALQGRGIGLALLLAVFDWASAQEAERLRLEVRASNQRAVAIYDKAGFYPIGRRIGYYIAPVEDAVVMERMLRPSGEGRSIHSLA